jgi:hypothetical protein
MIISEGNIIPSAEIGLDKLLQLAGNFLLIVLIFFCTTNVLFSFPLDKAGMFLMTVAMAAINPQKKIFTAREFSVLVVIIIIAGISSMANLILVPMIFFPVLGLAFSLSTSRFPKIILHSMYYALLIHMILGIIFLILAFSGSPNPFVYSLLGKGFNFLYSERGFTATVQTFGTLCLTWLLIYFLRRELGLNSLMDKLFFIINCFAVLGTLNRSTLLFWMIIIFLKERKLFITIVICLGILLVKFWQGIIAFITVSSSLTARTELLQGFNLSFVQSHSLLVYLFGKGTNQLPENILSKVKWGYRSDIENGYAMLLHTYGSVGLAFYIVISVYLLSLFIKLRKWNETFILGYFLFIAPYFTQEFVSISFYFFLAVIFLMLDSTVALKGKKLMLA